MNNNQTIKVEDPLILVVDDDNVTLMMLEERLINSGYSVVKATTGEVAKDIILQKHRLLDAVLLDRVMPDMDGIEIVNWLKDRHDISRVPVIMQTGSDNPAQIKEGIDAGVFYYLTKPIQEAVLKSVVSAAVKESRQQKLLRLEMGKHKQSFKLINKCQFQFRSLEEGENVACFLANCFPEPEKVLPGIAALITNAIEHGNLNISYDQKTELVKLGRWREEIEKRLVLKEYAGKKVTVTFSKEKNKYLVQILDEGQGFPWKQFMKIDPSRALDNHGRGIARANMIFNKIEYNKAGNELVATTEEGVQESVDW